jgi:hypothetical protein
LFKTNTSKETNQLQWLLDLSQLSGDSLNNVSRHFRNKRWEYLKEKTNQFATNSKKKNIRDLYAEIKEFKKSYKYRCSSVNENGDMLAYSDSFLNRCKNYFFQVLNVHGVNDGWQMEIHTAVIGT